MFLIAMKLMNKKIQDFCAVEDAFAIPHTLDVGHSDHGIYLGARVSVDQSKANSDHGLIFEAYVFRTNNLYVSTSSVHNNSSIRS